MSNESGNAQKQPSPLSQADTRMERLTEATESLFNALLDARGTRGDAARRAFDGVQSARAEYKDALRAFMLPMVRVLEGGLAGQAAAPGDAPFHCAKCNETKRCKLDCPDWHASIRAAINDAPDTLDETEEEADPEICSVCDMPPGGGCFERNCPHKGHA